VVLAASRISTNEITRLGRGVDISVAMAGASERGGEIYTDVRAFTRRVSSTRPQATSSVRRHAGIRPRRTDPASRKRGVRCRHGVKLHVRSTFEDHPARGQEMSEEQMKVY